jgi:hypothetical protein
MTLVGVGAVGVLGAPDPAATPLDPAAERLDRLMERHRCSMSGLGEGVIPRSAIIRVDDDPPRVVSFERGWASYEGRRPGTLVAVCRDAR